MNWYIQMPPEAEEANGKSWLHAIRLSSLLSSLSAAFVAVILEGAAPSFSIIKAKTE